MEVYELADIEQHLRGVLSECIGDYIVWITLILIVLVALLGNTLSFWLGVVIGLSIPYYIVPKFCGVGGSIKRME